MSITIEGLPIDVVARRKERIEEIEAEVDRLIGERQVLLQIVREIDGKELIETPTAAAISRYLDGQLTALADEDLPANVPPPDADRRKKPSLRRLIDQVLADGSRRMPSEVLFEVNKHLRAQGRLSINLADLEPVLIAGFKTGRLSNGAAGVGLVESLAQAPAAAAG